MESYAKKKYCSDILENVREEHRNAFYQYCDSSTKFYRDLAKAFSTIKGKENAKPASYFVNLLASNEEEQRGIAATIGALGNIVHNDEIAKHCGYEVSKGIASKFFPNLRRDTKKITKYHAEVDENGKALGLIKKKQEIEYVYYTV